MCLRHHFFRFLFHLKNQTFGAVHNILICLAAGLNKGKGKREMGKGKRVNLRRLAGE